MTDRDQTERTIAAVIKATPIPLTAGAVLRVMQTNGAAVPSRTTIQRILDRMVANNAIGSVTRTIEKNGHVIDARHYCKRADVDKVANAQRAYRETNGGNHDDSLPNV